MSIGSFFHISVMVLSRLINPWERNPWLHRLQEKVLLLSAFYLERTDCSKSQAKHMQKTQIETNPRVHPPPPISQATRVQSSPKKLFWECLWSRCITPLSCIPGRLALKMLNHSNWLLWVQSSASLLRNSSFTSCTLPLPNTHCFSPSPTISMAAGNKQESKGDQVDRFAA